MKEPDITTEHPEHVKFSKRWVMMNDALGDEDDIKGKGEKYLPKTGGMKANDDDDTRYKAYKARARFPEITTQALTAMNGLIFENDPDGVTDDIITNAGQSNIEFARDVTRAVASKGRDILVVDAPPGSQGGGDPFIARYSAESLINWKSMPGKPSDIRLAIFKEAVEDASSGEYGHETETQYRQYRRVDNKIEVSVWMMINDKAIMIDEPVVLPVDFMPVIAVGSIDSVPNCDPIPLLPVARCAIAYYQLSADYRMSLHVNNNPTPWLKGVNQEQYSAIQAIGIGAGSLWSIGENPDAEVGFLETTGASHADSRTAMEDELKQAETYAVRLTQSSDSPESGVAISKRAASQHASIYTIADSVSIAVTQAQRMRAIWAGEAEPEDFKLDAKIDEEYAGEQMINALNTAINSGNAPRSSLYEAIRKAGLSPLDNQQMTAEIETDGGNLLGGQ